MTVAKIKQCVLPNLPYAFLLRMFDKIGETYRLATDADVLHKAMATVNQLNAAFAHPLPSFNPQDLLVGIVGAAAVYGFVQYKKHHRKKWRKDVEYGSARWGNKDNIAPYQDPVPEKNVILSATESLMLDGRPANPKHARNKNILIVGGSGSGKTRFFVKPNLMQMHSSYVFTDPNVTVFIGQIATAGLGITLTATSTLVFYSHDYSMSNFEQAKARIHCVGQTENCTYIYLTAKGTVDEKVLKALRDKADLARLLVDDYRQGLNPFS